MPLHDPPEAEAMSLQVVGRLTTQTASWGLELLDGRDAAGKWYPFFERFWSWFELVRVIHP